VEAFDFEHIYEACTIAEDDAICFADGAGVWVSWYGVVAAFGNHFCAGFDDGSSFDEAFDKAVVFKASEGVLGVEVGVFPICADNHTDGEVVF